MEEIGNVRVTTYYSPVESFYPKADLVAITGWVNRETDAVDISGRKVPLGRYPRRFLTHLRNEGSGKRVTVAVGPSTHLFLNYSFEGMPSPSGAGYWLDTCARDGYGKCLIPKASAAASEGLLRSGELRGPDYDNGVEGTRFSLVGCGRGATEKGCAFYRSGRWQVRDQFTTGIASERQVDLYYGVQDFAGFRSSDFWTTMDGAVLGTGA